MIYIFIFSLLLVLRYVFSRAIQARSRLYPILLVALFVFSAFRFGVGCDWHGYLHQFEAQRWQSFSDALSMRDPAWWATIVLTQRLGLPYPFINFFSSAIFFAGVHVLARRQVDPFGFLVLLFPVLVINMPMSGIRQAAAVGLMCVAYATFLDKRLLAFLIWTFVASLFHTSAIIFLLLAPLVGGRYTMRRVAAATVLAIPGAYALIGGSGAELAIGRYVDTSSDAAGAVFRLGMLLVTGLFFLFYAERRWALSFPEDYRLVHLGSMMMLVIFPVVFVSTVIGDRFGYYLVPIQTMILARIPYLFPGQQNRLLHAAPYIGLALMFLVWTYMSRHFNLCYLPYQTWLFGFPSDSFYIPR
ncbi:MAG: EpsG family protein [Parvibaculum sp.]|nr:EpsG family protein [Parvibaculum sp.]